MLNRRQIYLACAAAPTYGGACTDAEVKSWRRSLAGTVVHEPDFGQFTAFNRNGKRKWFDYCHQPFEAAGCCEGDYDFIRNEAAYWALRSTAKYST